MSSLQRLPLEALAMICDALMVPDRAADGYTYAYTGLNTLLALARTSRAFHEHALNAIWETLPGYSFLVYTLPSDAWTVEVKEAQHSWSSPRTELSITRPLVPEDLVRLKYYARRVKYILRPFDCSFLTKRARNHHALTTVLKALADVFRGMPGEIMLPNLLTLRLEAPDNRNATEQDTFFRSADVLYGPKLQIFVGTTYSRPPLEAYKTSLMKLTEISPGLRNFNVSLIPWQTPLAAPVSEAICRFNHLENVYTDNVPISPEAFLHLAQLETLQSIDCKMHLDSDDQFMILFALAEDKGYFPNVLDFSIRHQFGIALPIVMLRAVSSPRLHSVTVAVHERTIPSRRISELFIVLADRRGSSRLRSVEVEFCKLEPDDAVTLDTVGALIDLPKLTSVVVRGNCRYVIDDISLRLMAAAWPRIRRLELGPERVADAPAPLATLAGLIPLAQNCPDLRSLAIALDTNVKRIPTPYRVFRPGLGFEQRRLIMLKVGRSRIEDPVAVAAFLSDLFPKLCNIENDFAFEEDAWEDFEGDEEERERILADAAHRDRWSKVDWDYLPRFVKIRKQERKWGKKMGMKPLPPMRLVKNLADSK